MIYLRETVLYTPINPTFYVSSTFSSTLKLETFLRKREVNLPSLIIDTLYKQQNPTVHHPGTGRLMCSSPSSRPYALTMQERCLRICQREVFTVLQTKSEGYAVAGEPGSQLLCINPSNLANRICSMVTAAMAGGSACNEPHQQLLVACLLRLCIN